MKGYCMHCRVKRDMQDPVEKMGESGTCFAQGTCSVCGGRISLLLGKRKVESISTPETRKPFLRKIDPLTALRDMIIGGGVVVAALGLGTPLPLLGFLFIFIGTGHFRKLMDVVIDILSGVKAAIGRAGKLRELNEKEQELVKWEERLQMEEAKITQIKSDFASMGEEFKTRMRDSLSILESSETIRAYQKQFENRNMFEEQILERLERLYQKAPSISQMQAKPTTEKPKVVIKEKIIHKIRLYEENEVEDIAKRFVGTDLSHVRVFCAMTNRPATYEQIIEDTIYTPVEEGEKSVTKKEAEEAFKYILDLFSDYNDCFERGGYIISLERNMYLKKKPAYEIIIEQVPESALPTPSA